MTRNNYLSLTVLSTISAILMPKSFVLLISFISILSYTYYLLYLHLRYLCSVSHLFCPLYLLCLYLGNCYVFVFYGSFFLCALSTLLMSSMFILLCIYTLFAFSVPLVTSVPLSAYNYAFAFFSWFIYPFLYCKLQLRVFTSNM